MSENFYNVGPTIALNKELILLSGDHISGLHCSTEHSQFDPRNLVGITTLPLASPKQRGVKVQ